MRDTADLLPADSLPARTDQRSRGHIVIDAVSVFYGDCAAVHRVSLDLPPGRFQCLLGPSGCGKSTILKCVAGFEQPTEGEVRLDDAPVIGPGADRGVVFQQPWLFPWKTVRGNIAHGPRMRGLAKREANAIAEDLLNVVGLSGFANHYPQALSGGMQQRTAIARVLANDPGVMLMDEPFAALDAQTRLMMQDYLLELWTRIPKTILFITHDIDEALLLADRVAVMSAGPGTIMADFAIDLPRPRPADVYLDPSFLRVKKQCVELIRGETMKAFDNKPYKKAL